MTLPRRPSAVILDMDGTLHDTEAVYLAALKQAVAAVGFAVTDEFCHSLIGIPGTESDALLRAHMGPGFPATECLQLYRENCAVTLAASVPVKPGARELMEALAKSGIPTAIATSARRQSAEAHLNQSGLRAHVRLVVTRDDVHRGKPHPDLFSLAAERLAVRAGEIVAIEDSFNGIRAAHAAGMMPIMVPDLLAPTDEIRAMCVRVARDLHEVYGLLAAQINLA